MLYNRKQTNTIITPVGEDIITVNLILITPVGVSPTGINHNHRFINNGGWWDASHGEKG